MWRNLVTLPGTTRALHRGGLVNGRTYYFRVIAANRLGWGPWSPSVRARPVAPPCPTPAVIADALTTAYGSYSYYHSVRYYNIRCAGGWASAAEDNGIDGAFIVLQRVGTRWVAHDLGTGGECSDIRRPSHGRHPDRLLTSASPVAAAAICIVAVSKDDQDYREPSWPAAPPSWV